MHDAANCCAGMFKPDFSSIQGQRRAHVGWDQGPSKARFDPDQGWRGVSSAGWKLVKSIPMDSPTAHEPLSRVRQCLHSLAEIGDFLKAGALAVSEIGLGRWPKAANLDRGELSTPDDGRGPIETSARFPAPNGALPPATAEKSDPLESAIHAAQMRVGATSAAPAERLAQDRDRREGDPSSRSGRQKGQGGR